jgi:hypothetical protein
MKKRAGDRSREGEYASDRNRGEEIMSICFRGFCTDSLLHRQLVTVPHRNSRTLSLSR